MEIKTRNNRPKHCVNCNSKRIRVTGTTFYCERCGYLNKDFRIKIRNK